MPTCEKAVVSVAKKGCFADVVVCTIIDIGVGVVVVTWSMVVGGRTTVVGRGPRRCHTIDAGGGGPSPSSMVVMGWWSCHCQSWGGGHVVVV